MTNPTLAPGQSGETMIERVARAMATQDGLDPDYRREFDDVPQWRYYVPAARVAMAAMREPSNRALDAGLSGYMRGVLACYQSIIDAALAEEPVP